MFKKLFSIKHSMFNTPVPKGGNLELGVMGALTMFYEAEGVKFFLEPNEKIVLVHSPEPYLEASAKIFQGVFNYPIKVYEHPTNLKFIGQPGNHQPMLDFLKEKAFAEKADVVILLTNRPGIADLGIFLEKISEKYYFNFHFLLNQPQSCGTMHMIDLTRNEIPSYLSDFMQIKPKDTVLV